MIKSKNIVRTIILISLLFIISIFSASCSSLFDPDYRGRFRPYDLRGTWVNISDCNERFTISYDGILIFYNADGTYNSYYISNWDREKYKEKNYYELIIPNIPILGSIVLYFISDSECEISYGSKPNMVFYYEKI